MSRGNERREEFDDLDSIYEKRMYTVKTPSRRCVLQDLNVHPCRPALLSPILKFDPLHPATNRQCMLLSSHYDKILCYNEKKCWCSIDLNACHVSLVGSCCSSSILFSELHASDCAVGDGRDK